MGKFIRKDIPLCACGCREQVGKNKGHPNRWNKYIALLGILYPYAVVVT